MRGELWFSTNSDAANKTLIAYQTSWAASREWTKYASQKSAAIPLVAGQSYYLETLQKENGGGDNLAVAWMGPAPFDTTNVIAAANLKQPFSGFSAPRFNARPVDGSRRAGQRIPYASTLADNVTDTNANETLAFAKLSGPGLARRGRQWRPHRHSRLRGPRHEHIHRPGDRFHRFFG